MMMEGAGFEVIDLGINNPVEKYLAALEEHKPDILGMSALLTTTMPYMKVVIDTMKEKGIRDDYIVLVGGAPLNEAFGKAVGADAYCRDAAIAVETAKALIAARRACAPRADAHDARWAADPHVLVDRLRRARPRDRRAAARRTAGRTSTSQCLPRGAAQPAGAHSRRPCAKRSAQHAAATRRSSSPTATAAPAASSTRCWPRRASSALPGAHCYEFFAGAAAFAALADAEPGTFYLTDFLLRHFDRLVIAGLGLDRHPGAAARVFRQLPAARLPRADRRRRSCTPRRARRPQRLGLAFAHRVTGYGELATSLASRASRAWTGMPAWQS